MSSTADIAHAGITNHRIFRMLIKFIFIICIAIETSPLNWACLTCVVIGHIHSFLKGVIYRLVRLSIGQKISDLLIALPNVYSALQTQRSGAQHCRPHLKLLGSYVYFDLSTTVEQNKRLRGLYQVIQCLQYMAYSDKSILQL
jgi:hypothetical protein